MDALFFQVSSLAVLMMIPIFLKFEPFPNEEFLIFLFGQRNHLSTRWVSNIANLASKFG